MSIVDPQENREFFDGRAATWDLENQPNASHDATAFLLGLEEGMRVLDVACGTGNMVEPLLRSKPSRIVGVDVSPKMIECACAKFAHEKVVEFICADLMAWDTNQRFERAVLYNCYPHFGDHRALAAKLAELVAPGGRFIVAHGRGRDGINKHHQGIEHHVHSHMLLDPETEAKPFERYFDIDVITDVPHFYCFGGTRKS